MDIRSFYRPLTTLCALTAAVSLSACSSTGSAPTTNTDSRAAEKGAVLKVAYWESSTSDKAGWDLMLKNFAKDHPEIKLEPQVYPSDTYRQILDTRIAGNDWPDIVRYTYQRLGKFKENDVMLDLTGKISEESLKDLVPAYRSAVTYKGKLVAMPHHTDTMAIFYNKSMFQKSGIRIPKDVNDAWTWDELTGIARKLKADNNLEYAFGGIWENGSGYRYLPFIYMNGGSVLSKDMKSVTINSPEALAATKLYETWQKEKLVVKTGFTQTPATNMLFVAKKIAFTFSGSWHLSYMEENMPGNWGVTYMPQVKGKTGSDMGGNALFAYKGTKYPNAAAIFIDYMTSKDNMKAFSEASNFIPVRTSLLNEGLKYTSFQNEMNLFLNIVKTIDPKLAEDETSDRFQQLNEIYSKNMDPLVVNGSATAEQVLQKTQKDMTDALK
ncbi:sugar ABC transporter substrate-binding protein [Paenibacillus filicis]|uniref:Sugar ABC transporter substrate-binding protein n=1 Tax=Paenibacillus gyeongsangnamensis TaxID=3388067 RepID=A0ABT4Q3Z1_9BACL|nr:sugar ABC transporter substrate-binding protein [Paenibacillus filicis]MCZ8511578.1 sugar ABC transporter substrate-binding protein [Paenibacillus filicis]